MYKRKSSDCQISSVVRSASNHQWGVETWSRSSYIQMELAAGYHPTGGNNQPMDGSHHHLITNILPVDTTDPDSDWKDFIKQNMCQKSQCKWPGVYVVLHTTTIFYICILPLTNVLENAFYFLSTKNTWITSWFGQEHTTTILCPLSSLFYDVTSCGVLSHHRTTWTWCGVASDSLSAAVVGSTTTELRWWVGREPLGLEEMVQFERKFLYWRVTNIPTFLYYHYNIFSILSQRDCMSIYTTVLGHILIQIWCRGVPFLEMVTLMSTGTDITEWTTSSDLRVPTFTNTWAS